MWRIDVIKFILLITLTNAILYCTDWFEFVGNWHRSQSSELSGFLSDSQCILEAKLTVGCPSWHQPADVICWDSSFLCPLRFLNSSGITPFMLALWHQGQNKADGSSKTWGLWQGWYQEYGYYGPIKKKDRKKDNKEVIRTQVHLEKLCICPYFFGLWFIDIVNFVAIGLQTLPHQQSVKASLIPADIFGESTRQASD